MGSTNPPVLITRKKNGFSLYQKTILLAIGCMHQKPFLRSLLCSEYRISHLNSFCLFLHSIFFINCWVQYHLCCTSLNFSSACSLSLYPRLPILLFLNNIRLALPSYFIGFTGRESIKQTNWGHLNYGLKKLGYDSENGFSVRCLSSP